VPKRNRREGDSTHTGRARRSTPQDEMLAAGRIPLGPQGNAGEPTRVQLVSGTTDFFDAFKAALGTGSSTAAGGDQFQAVLRSQEAMTQAAREITEELKVATAMMRDLSVRSTENITRMNEQSARQRIDDRAQMDQLIQVLATGGGPGGGGGARGIGGGHGGGHGGAGSGHGYYDPASGRFASYGGIGSRINARAANWIHNNYGTPSVGRHASPATQRSAAMMSRVAGGFAHGGAGMALRRIPYVGTAIAAAEGVNDIAEWLTNERAQNARYQSVLGGSNSSMDNRGNPLTSLGGLTDDLSQFFSGSSSSSTSGLGNRMAEEGYTIGQRFSSGGFDEDSARQLFQGVTSLGYTGDRRAGALDFAGANYKTMGMGQDESMQLIATSAKYAQSSLQGLSRELQNVTKTATRTGQSAQVVRQAFAETYAAALQASGGAGSGALAAAATNMTGAGGRLLAGANPLSVLNDPTSKYQMASTMGMTPSQLEVAGQTNPGITMQALGKRSDMYMRSLGSGNMKVLQDAITKSGGNQKVAADSNLMQNVASELMGSQGYDVTVAKNIVSQIDPSMANASDSAIAQYIVNYVAGNNPGNQAAGLQDSMTPKNISQGEREKIKNPNQNGDATGKGFGNFAWDQNKRGKDMQSDAGMWSNLFNGDQTEQGYTLQVNSDYYNELTKGTGKSDPVIEKLISEYGTDPNIRFKVKTKNGDKAVTFGEAIRNFSDQLSSGQASIVSSNKDINNRSVKDIAGTTGARVTSDQNDWQGSDFDKVADEVGAGTADQAAADNSGGGSVKVGLTPGAEKLIQLLDAQGNVSLDNSAASGRPMDQSTGPK
jgi:hypothetical protein